jgi:hypothetical protein
VKERAGTHEEFMRRCIQLGFLITNSLYPVHLIKTLDFPHLIIYKIPKALFLSPQTGRFPMAKRYLSVLITTLLLTAFSPNFALSQEQTITVGSFNLEWLGHSFKSRDQKDLSILARYIRSLEVDVLCLQEVSPTGDVTGNGQADWQELLDLLNTPFFSRILIAVIHTD